jgi:transposase
MVYRAIHRDVKIAAIQLSERQLLLLNDILLCCGFSRSTFFRILKLWRETGDVVHERVVYGRYRTLHQTDIHYLLQLIRQNPDYFLDELLRMLKTNRFISVHYTTIHDELVRAGVSRKRLQRIALERNEALRADFIARMAQFSPEELGFIDEVSKDERTVGRRYGRSRRGTRARKSQPFVRGRRTSTVGVLSVDGFVAGTSVEGSLTKASFLHWMEFTVVSFFLYSPHSKLTFNSYHFVAHTPALSVF